MARAGTGKQQPVYPDVYLSQEPAWELQTKPSDIYFWDATNIINSWLQVSLKKIYYSRLYAVVENKKIKCFLISVMQV